MSIHVTLSMDETAFGAHIGLRRQLKNMAQGKKDAYGLDHDPWAVHIRGALAELAFAKAFDIYWKAVVNDPSTLPGDVGGYQVRSSHRENACLIVHERDDDDAPFYLVTGTAPDFHIVGWLLGHEAKQDEFWRQGKRPAFFVPPRFLRAPERAAVAVAA